MVFALARQPVDLIRPLVHVARRRRRRRRRRHRRALRWHLCGRQQTGGRCFAPIRRRRQISMPRKLITRARGRRRRFLRLQLSTRIAARLSCSLSGKQAAPFCALAEQATLCPLPDEWQPGQPSWKEGQPTLAAHLRPPPRYSARSNTPARAATNSPETPAPLMAGWWRRRCHQARATHTFIWINKRGRGSLPGRPADRLL